jgi:hypothetical protein
MAFSATLTSAQTARKFHFGLHASPNISWIKPDVQQPKYSSDGTIIGMSYGAAFENFFSPNLGIGTGVNVMSTGGKLSFTDAININVNNVITSDTGIMTRKYKLQYVEVPLFLIGSTGEVLGNFSFYGKFGLSSAFRIKAKADDEYTPSTGSVITAKSVNIEKEVSFFREAMIIGLGCAYKFGQVAALYAGVTYNNGFTDVLKGENNAYPTVKEKARSNFVEINIGVMF